MIYIVPIINHILNPSMFWEMITVPVCVSSITPIAERIEVSFKVIINWLTNEGIINLNHWGAITLIKALLYGNPKLRAASHCPILTDSNPPLTMAPI